MCLFDQRLQSEAVMRAAIRGCAAVSETGKRLLEYSTILEL